MQLHTKILVGLVAGAIVGAIAEQLGVGHYVVALEPLGQAFSQIPQDVQAFAPFSSCGMCRGPRKRSNIFRVSRFSGYCWVMTVLGLIKYFRVISIPCIRE